MDRETEIESEREYSKGIIVFHDNLHKFKSLVPSLKITDYEISCQLTIRLKKK